MSSDFNPRAYVRHDLLAENVVKALTGFQSTCLREARLCPDVDARQALDFNPRAYVRHDVNTHLLDIAVKISIHVPT